MTVSLAGCSLTGVVFTGVRLSFAGVGALFFAAGSPLTLADTLRFSAISAVTGALRCRLGLDVSEEVSGGSRTWEVNGKRGEIASRARWMASGEDQVEVVPGVIRGPIS